MYTDGVWSLMATTSMSSNLFVKERRRITTTSKQNPMAMLPVSKNKIENNKILDYRLNVHVSCC